MFNQCESQDPSEKKLLSSQDEEFTPEELNINKSYDRTTVGGQPLTLKARDNSTAITSPEMVRDF